MFALRTRNSEDYVVSRCHPDANVRWRTSNMDAPAADAAAVARRNARRRDKRRRRKNKKRSRQLRHTTAQQAILAPKMTPPHRLPTDLVFEGLPLAERGAPSYSSATANPYVSIQTARPPMSFASSAPTAAEDVHPPLLDPSHLRHPRDTSDGEPFYSSANTASLNCKL